MEEYAEINKIISSFKVNNPLSPRSTRREENKKRFGKTSKAYFCLRQCFQQAAHYTSSSWDRKPLSEKEFWPVFNVETSASNDVCQIGQNEKRSSCREQKTKFVSETMVPSNSHVKTDNRFFKVINSERKLT